MRQLLGTWAIVVAMLLALPAGASAAVQVTIGGYDLPGGASDPIEALIISGTNGDDQVTATFVANGVLDADDQLRITSTSSTIDDAAVAPFDTACVYDGAALVCELDAVTDDVWIFQGGDGDDELELDAPLVDYASVWMFGGVGDDTLRGSGGPDNLFGEDGVGGEDCADPLTNPAGVVSCDDVIHDGLGLDIVEGEGGNDTLVQPVLGGRVPASDEDDVRLGDGSADTITYAARPEGEPVVVRIGASDGIDTGPAEELDASGTPGEEDDLQDVERAVGSAGNDTFRVTNPGGALEFDGAGGDDTFIATTATERFVGGAGTDTVTYLDAASAFDGITATANGVADDGDGEGDDIGSDIERIIGSTGDDTIVGAAVPGCRIAGGAGTDALTAGSTGCTLEGGNGADVLTGGAGADVLRPGGSGTATTDQLTFGGGADTVDYGSTTLVGADAVVVGVQASANPGATVWCAGLGTGTTSARKTVLGQQHLDTWSDAPETIVGTLVTDTLCGGPAGTRIEGGAGADVVIGSSGPDVLLGGLGNDLVHGQGGNDVIDGGDGADNVNGGAGSDVVDGGPGDDPAVRGGGGSDTIRGGAGNDVLDEVAFSTIEQGVAGEELDAGDVLDGGPGTDVLDGASGVDVVACTVENLADTWRDTGGGSETMDCSALGVPIAYAAGPGIDAIVGTAFNDVLSGAATIDGGGGNDQLTAAGGGSTLRGGVGNDTLIGSESADVLIGGDGADVLDARGGDDALDGGSGGDVISGGAGAEAISYENRARGVTVTLDGVANDGEAGEGDNVQADVEELVGTSFGDSLTAGGSAVNLIGGGGDDVLVGSPAGELLRGGAGRDRLVGGAGANVLEGGPGDDTLLGGRDADRLDGGEDHDTLDGGLGRDSFVGGSGRDTVSYATRVRPVIVTLGDRTANDGQAGERENVPIDVENVIGGRRNDRLVGNNLANSLRGGTGNDTLLAGLGNDVLFGGPGNDVLTGGRGNDRHYGEAGNDRIDSRDTTPRDRRFRELVDGGAGRDSVQRDARDRILRIERRAIVKRVSVRGRVVSRLLFVRIGRIWRA